MTLTPEIGVGSLGEGRGKLKKLPQDGACSKLWVRSTIPAKRVGTRPFSIVLVKLAFNATRNSRKKPKKAKIMPDFFKNCHLNSKNALFYFKQNVQTLTLYAHINNR